MSVIELLLLIFAGAVGALGYCLWAVWSMRRRRNSYRKRWFRRRRRHSGGTADSKSAFAPLAAVRKKIG